MRHTPTGVECPTCGRDAAVVVDGQCVACADDDLAAVIERLEPEGRR